MNYRAWTFLMISGLSWAILLFSMSMIIMTALNLIPDGSYAIWTNMITFIIGIWIPQPKNKEKLATAPDLSNSVTSGPDNI